MKLSVATSTAVLFASVNGQLLDIPGLLQNATMNLNDPRFTQWQAPGEGDVRSPCPGLNSLANHGFLPRSGKGLTIPRLIQGGAQGLNMGPDFMAVIGAVGLLSSPNPAGGSFDLDNLDIHNFPIEHDGSLSRLDKYFGDNADFNQQTWDATVAYFNGLIKTTTPTASKARYMNIQKSQANNPTSLYGPMQFLLSSGETALYVQTMDSPITNSARVDYVRSLFEQEKLPYELGWRPSAVPITLLSLGGYILELFAANPDAIGEGTTILKDSYANALISAAGGANALRNLTQGITDVLDIPGL
ncbi:Putative sterigmatocystin biosynthesis peroxidase [Fulvia fulva]|uniref:Sterigmatocystin biosynthesis peroxidase n=1 Tax=Passalora fulva TaxID=5499 RepID=A0A9Q8PCY2_PASFU|nr:Putative sterigmatocystin biosynthesis peroxidase [Fulvia fulva]KAK4619542.1 putative sterigmatocystin biosynthesis peroxidase [Fulvia fulva]KAK4620677.1 putative sterigmatocystin biosynthesis peroxidase [Fulvia fulva]UJO20146.1 Putative sterigmatocystin biosynthesis peroxidase [Fulvia fulva]WPV17767.1 Putative sterigmatocystin biosynthesis peroxidase [Fulvia fulva]WPV31976.1 Putative sterigmatocystin biosynthesis peroxidase [Fulvia fulva]